MSLELKNINSAKDVSSYLEGCLNDFEMLISTKEETMDNIVNLIIYLNKRKS